MNFPASLPAPPYCAVILASQRSASEAVEYDHAAARMLQPATLQSGFCGLDSARGADGFGLTVSYWRDEASIAASQRGAEPAVTRQHGRDAWYEAFEVGVARIERAYGLRPGTADV